MRETITDHTESHTKVYAALDMLLSNDQYLLRRGIGKVALAHKLAEYLQPLFREWEVDCGYDGTEYKPIAVRVAKLFSEPVNPYPDIVIHHRVSKKRLLVIEISRTSEGNAIARAHERKVFTYLHELKFTLGLHLTLDTTNSLGQPFITGWQLARPQI